MLFDPFAGCGSGALMARELGIKYVGAELNSFRGSSALAKGFLSVEVLLDAGREEPGLVEHVARTMMDTHKLRFGEAIELIEADLRASPPPCDGYMHLGDFRDVPRPEWISGRPCVLLLCPPFPGSPSRWPHVDGIAPDVRAEILREEVGPFEKLLSDAAAWFRDCSSGSEIRVVTAEYFDYFPEYSAGLATVTALAKLDLEMTVGILEESDRSPLGRSGFVVAGASLPDQWKSNN